MRNSAYNIRKYNKSGDSRVVYLMYNISCHNIATCRKMQERKTIEMQGNRRCRNNYAFIICTETRSLIITYLLLLVYQNTVITNTPYKSAITLINIYLVLDSDRYTDTTISVIY